MLIIGVVLFILLYSLCGKYHFENFGSMKLQRIEDERSTHYQDPKYTSVVTSLKHLLNTVTANVSLDYLANSFDGNTNTYVFGIGKNRDDTRNRSRKILEYVNMHGLVEILRQLKNNNYVISERYMEHQLLQKIPSHIPVILVELSKYVYPNKEYQYVVKIFYEHNSYNFVIMKNGTAKI
jgi:hypothetical protein